MTGLPHGVFYRCMKAVLQLQGAKVLNNYARSSGITYVQ